jgi:hypothetical protein
MKIIITERQFKSLREQTSVPDVNAIKNFVNKQGTTTGTARPTQQAAKPIQPVVKPTQQAAKPTQPTSSTNLNLQGKTLAPKYGPQKPLTPEEYYKKYGMTPSEAEHKNNQIFAIGASFFPVIGPLVATITSLADAKQYYDEGDNVSAGVVGAFSLLPYVGPVVSKIPGVKQLGQKGMAALAAKIAKGTPITDATELAVINGLKTNNELVKSSLNTHVKTLAQQGVAKTTNNATKTQLGKIAKKGMEEVGTEYIEDKTIQTIKQVAVS